MLFLIWKGFFTWSNQRRKKIQTFVRPQLEYGSKVWSPQTKTQIDQIENVQRRAARWIKLDYGQTSSITDMLHFLKFRKLELRRIVARLSLLYKIHHGLVAIPIEEYLTPLSRISCHGHPLCYRLFTATSDYCKISFFPRTVYHWDCCPSPYPRAVQCSHTGA
jgi:hypothetical protein